MTLKHLQVALGLFFISIMLSSCEAIRVVTHEVNKSPQVLNIGSYKSDPTHVSVIFKVNHFGFSNYVGRFNEIDANLYFNNQYPDESRISAIIDTASVDTDNQLLDAQLRGPNFFDVEIFPKATFIGESIILEDNNHGKVIGTLSIRDEEIPITLDVTFNGGAKNPLTGEDTLGFSAIGTFNRSDIGLTAWLPAVGNTVIIEIEVEFIRQNNG
ncbi:MAG: hypothetical protein CMM30_01950 [Rhodospirillaceae bacterium]|nr:hypothetical protein [Rhodospirillaceae bacterium]|tara:strand:- start:518 stop:1156 length:639 start_codon:yes stop_codon:yes gene_type:complete